MKRRSGILVALAVVGGLTAIIGFGLLASDGEGSDDAAVTSPSTDPSSSSTTGSGAPESTVTSPAENDGPPFVEEAPVHVLATAGPVDETASYVLVTWDHAVPDAVAYEVERDGTPIGRVEVDDDPYDDTLLRDDQVAPGQHRYRVRALGSDREGPWSTEAAVRVRASSEIGPVFEVDGFSGSDRQQAQRAVDAAEEAGGGIVLFGAGTYSFDDPLQITGDGVLLRGAGEDKTTLKVSRPGGDTSCGQVTPLLLFRGDLEVFDVTLAEAAAAGASRLVFDRRPPVVVGDVIAVDGVIGQLPTGEYAERGIAQDPTIPNDARYPFDAGSVVAIDGNAVEIDHPLSQDIPAGAELQRYRTGHGNGLELLTVEGLSAEDATYHRLIDVRDQVDFRVTQVTARYANRNFLDASGHHLTMVGFTGIEGGAGGFEPEPCKYKVGFGPATDVEVVGSTFGSLDDDRNMSLLTFQFTYRGVVRNSVFGQSRTYGFNEHGGGSRDLVFENNYVAAGSSGWAGILLGNDTWGFGGETAIRNNQFVDNINDVLMVENPYGVAIVGNRSSGCTSACIMWSGWGGEEDGYSPIPDPARWGSAKLLIARNVMADAAVGLRLGTADSVGYPWEGIRDLVIAGNQISSSAGALELLGSADATGRVWAFDNLFTGGVKSGTPGTDWWFWENSDGPTLTEAELPEWADAYQPWERNHLERRWNQ